MENKQKICNLLLKTLQATRHFSDLKDLVYQEIEGAELVKAKFESGGIKTVNVTMDSGIAMIRDILRQIT